VAVVEAPQIEAPQIEAPVIEAPRVEAPAAAAAPAPPPAPAPAAHGALIHRPTNQTFVLAGRPEFLVGRPDPVTGINPEVNLGPLDETRSLSRRHAKIAVNDGIYVLREDVGTTNGTFVNGERITTGAPVMLKPGDKIRFGSVEVEFTV
jgi:pSer/pThr/pTyr-binding forkhead associated (FHA) protein